MRSSESGTGRDIGLDFKDGALALGAPTIMHLPDFENLQLRLESYLAVPSV